ncbi:upstream stimulatory factor 2-like isoform X2 [Pollicipes pollicipes]|uniref:upstream stimulatory factor 2-like isoform X2 n=1 Tax=Pollicipes pollicipes TaxID=41117 RepID=UPI0018855198|nr:upstream stimulatory factor 2-like isoform X2 [Pollicipes pollicipes]XP_037086115.1 upstream stimulatory factor 2-like isoform X2 [Pollicipes pollicipes]
MNEGVDVKEVIPQNLAIVQYGDKEDNNGRDPDSPMQLQYFKAGGAPPGMTYRVVHINTTSGGSGEVVQQGLATGGGGGTTLLTAAAGAGEVADGQMAYIPSGSAGDGLAALSSTGAGGFYVISGPQDVGLGGGPARGPGRCEVHRDDRRRATHNEVERRRRDKINSWITKLGKLLPETGDPGKQNQVCGSKGAVLSQACDYVQDTRGMQQKYMELVRDNEKLLEDIKMLKQSNEALVTANQLLKAHLKSQGAVILETDHQPGGGH